MMVVVNPSDIIWNEVTDNIGRFGTFRTDTINALSHGRVDRSGSSIYFVDTSTQKIVGKSKGCVNQFLIQEHLHHSKRIGYYCVQRHDSHTNIFSRIVSFEINQSWVYKRLSRSINYTDSSSPYPQTSNRNVKRN